MFGAVLPALHTEGSAGQGLCSQCCNLQAAREHSGELVIAAIGPLTNLALACKLDLSFPERIKALYVMGGAERAGNVTPASEFNFHCDPEAAHLVLKKFPRTVRFHLAAQ